MKKRYITTTAALMLLTATVTYSATLYTSAKMLNENLNPNKNEQEYAKIAEVQGYIDRYYVNEYDKNQLTEGALYGMVAFLGDKWSYYLNAEQFAELNNSLNSKMVGIGVNAALDTDTGGILISEIFEGSPAEKAGLQPLDVITAVDGIEVSDIGYDAAVSKVRGKQGTSVRLTVLRTGAAKPLEFNIKRQDYEIQNVKSQIIGKNIGYIKIRTFDANVDKSVEEAIKNLKKANVRGIIFDVRNNPGGMLETLVNILNPLLPEGVIIKEKNKSGKTKEYKSDANELKLPMAVLVNEYSISAAEFFASSLQEYGKAVIVGTPTTGKGCAQQPIPLKDGSGLILSITKYYTAKGLNLAETGGIKPNRLIKLTADEQKRFYKLSQSQDRQLQGALLAVYEKIQKK